MSYDEVAPWNDDHSATDLSEQVENQVQRATDFGDLQNLALVGPEDDSELPHENHRWATVIGELQTAAASGQPLDEVQHLVSRLPEFMQEPAESIYLSALDDDTGDIDYQV